MSAGHPAMATWSVSEPAARPETPALRPMHLSTICHSLNAAREFYGRLLGCEERRATATSVHFDFFGSQLTLHEIKGHNATNFHREVDAEDVPVPHFGAALDEETFHNVAERLRKAEWTFVLNPHKRFLRKRWEQWVLFIQQRSLEGVLRATDAFAAMLLNGQFSRCRSGMRACKTSPLPS